MTMCGLARAQGIKHCDATAVARNPLADRVEDVSLVHGFHLQADLKSCRRVGAVPWTD